jgi:hypothetical protein
MRNPHGESTDEEIRIEGGTAGHREDFTGAGIHCHDGAWPWVAFLGLWKEGGTESNRLGCTLENQVDRQYDVVSWEGSSAGSSSKDRPGAPGIDLHILTRRSLRYSSKDRSTPERPIRSPRR